ncbi:hypothetical protein M9Y10_024045 [Tritrichomonas musculus]|uniref:Uncharacterized protein n=1 Tax=Tritrichomonas musculus TaxID=1915356 RepID=A0ABR2KWV9_9EUKA
MSTVVSISNQSSPRSIHSPKKSPQKDTRPFVYLYKVDFPDNPPKRIRLPKDMKELLQTATEVLELPRPAHQIFDSNDEPITEFEKILPKAHLYIVMTPPPPPEDDTPDYLSSPRKAPASPYKKLPIMKQPKSSPKPDDYNQQLQIASHPYTVKENLRNSIISLYASLNQDQISHISFADTIQKLSRDTQQFEFENILLSQYIGPTTVIESTPIGQQTTNWVMEKLKGLPVEDCRFLVTGPSQSGKSTLLSIAATLFFQKLQLANQLKSYLMFPLNWLLQQIYIDDVTKLYHMFVDHSVHMLQICRLELIPIIQSISNWLHNVITIPGIPAIPPTLTHYPGFPTKEFGELGKRIHDTWGRDDGFLAFVTEIVNFPNNLAKAFGFVSAIYVLDHFEACAFQLNPPTDKFKDERQPPVFLSEVICKTLNQCPFFIASQNDSEFFNIFSVKDFKQWTTERLITTDEERELVVLQAKVLITKNMCRGCPAYLALYSHVCDLASEVTRRAALKSQFSKLKSVADIARNEMLKQEFLRMCILLGLADTDGNFDENRMNDLMEMEEISIRVR